MAEFSEVMHQVQRMCHKSCTESRRLSCPFDCYVVNNFDIEEFESTVLDWATAHPELKYPTWYAWLVKIGVISWAKFDEDYHTHVYRCIMDSSIPADIAEKLGIEPIKEDK